MKIVFDEKIPYIYEYFSPFGELIGLPGNLICRDDLVNADILFTRSITPVNQTLLSETAVKFVGSMTAGIDHLDISWLKKTGIQFASASGANANAVAQYVIACIAYFQSNNLLKCRSPKIGIIGVGHVGSSVANYCQQIGAELLLNDPPRAQQPDITSTPLSKWHDLDLITIHTPLTMNGKHPTYHLIDDQLLNNQKSCLLLNTARGGIITPNTLEKRPTIQAAFDVFANEPEINPSELDHLLLTTPHIAGYSQQAKQRATKQVFQQAAAFFSWPMQEPTIATNHLPELALSTENNWQEKALSIYNPKEDDSNMRESIVRHPHTVAKAFEDLRRNYQLRNEWIGKS